MSFKITPNNHAQHAIACGTGRTVKRCAFAFRWRGRQAEKHGNPPQIYRIAFAPSEVMDWFESLSTEITAVPTEYGYVLYFREMGPLSHLPDGSIDADFSPVVTVVFPQVRRNILWTIGEVTFRPTPLQKKFPELHKINSALSKWLSSLECVFSNKRNENPYSYYLEGSAQNYDAPIYAFSSGLEALKKERYFVSHLDNQLRLDTLCKTLKLRGVECGAA